MRGHPLHTADFVFSNKNGNQNKTNSNLKKKNHIYKTLLQIQLKPIHWSVTQDFMINIFF